MRPDHHTAYDHLVRFVRGDPVPVHEQLVTTMLGRYALRSSSRRGFVIVVGDWLVRVADHRSQWTVQKLPQHAGVAREFGHQHVLRTVELPEGVEVLECIGCGSEW